MTTPRTLTLRPLFVTRAAVGAFVLTFLALVVAQAPPPSTGPEESERFAALFDVVTFALFVGVLLWMSWRNWRLAVHLSESEVTVQGFFRDRTLPRAAVLDIVVDQLVWERADGGIQVTPITAFLTPPAGLTGVVVRHNEKCLSLLRSELPDLSNGEPGLGGWDGRLRAEEDRHYDPPTYLRPRAGDEPAKHAREKRSVRDALPMMAQLAGSLLLSAFALWQLLRSLGGVAGADASSAIALGPYAPENVLGVTLPYLLMAALALASTVRLFRLALRQRPNPKSDSSGEATQ